MNLLRLSKGLVSIVCAGTLLVACSDDQTPPANPTGTGGSGQGGEGGSQPGETGIEGTLEYDGTLEGPAAYVALFLEFPPPPMSPPQAATRVADPMFPASFSFPNLDPGEFIAIAYLSVGTDHEQGPQSGDPVSAPTPVTVTEGELAQVTLVLQDMGAGGAGGSGTGGAGGSGAGGAGGSGAGGAGGN